MLHGLLISLALAVSGPAQATQPDPITLLLQQVEQAAAAANREAIRALGTEHDSATDLAIALTSPPPSRIVIRERDRTAIDGGQRLLVEVFWERGFEGRYGTWNLDVAEVPDEGWRIASTARAAHVTGLYRLRLTPGRQYEVRDLTVKAPDLALTLNGGAAFVAETPEGVTAVVLLGRGAMRFSPPDPAEQTQVRIFSGSEVLEAPFDAAFIRIRPDDFAARFPPGALVERAVSDRDFRRAQEVFDEYVGRTLQINMTDLSPDRWSISPQPGDFIAEVRTRRYGELTYTRSGNDPEDITLFERERRRNISVYASAAKLASRGRFYDDSDLVDYDVLEYDLAAAISPERQAIQGNVKLKLRIRAAATTTLNLRLAEDLTVHGVYAPEYGRLLHLRVVNQHALIVNLPATLLRGSEIWLQVIYSGRIPGQELEREAIAVQQPELHDSIVMPPEPRFIYSSRAYWYPQSVVSDYATVRMRITVPVAYEVVATGMPGGGPAPPPGVADDGARQHMFVFESDQPVRYLACVVSRFRDVDRRTITTDAVPDGIALRVVANPRQAARGRDLAGDAADIFAFYTELMEDVPYPGFTLGITEREVPGGHSPAYFAVVDQPQQSRLTWRNDPVNFDNYPAFFMAHEIAHQWWGQGVGWKNYHEQWLSEGFAQYFAALYAEERLATGVLANVLRQMRQTAIRQSSQGPVYLGYRLGHIKGDPRVFRSVLYNKSAMVLHMLRLMIGDEPFFRGVRSFFQTWKYRKAGTGDLIAAMEAASGRDLSAFFDDWIFGAGVAEGRFSYGTHGSMLALRLVQDGTPMEFPVSVRLTFQSGREETIVFVARDRVSQLTMKLDEPVRSVEANGDHGSLVTLR